MEFTVIGEPTEPEEVGKCTGGKEGTPLKIKPDIAENRVGKSLLRVIMELNIPGTLTAHYLCMAISKH